MHLNSREEGRIITTTTTADISRGFAKDQVCDGQGHMFSSPSDTRTLIAGSDRKPLRSQIRVWSDLGSYKKGKT